MVDCSCLCSQVITFIKFGAILDVIQLNGNKGRGEEKYFTLYHTAAIKEEFILSTLNGVFPYYQGESTIFDIGNFLYQTPDSKNL